MYHSDQSLIWIVSYPRSGNTWLRVLLHNLIGEMRGEKREAHDINALSQFTVWENGPRNYCDILGKEITESSPKEVALARPKVQRKLAENGHGVKFVKSHLCVGLDHNMPTINMSVTRAAVYIVRNPLDVAISYSFHLGLGVDDAIRIMSTPRFSSEINEGGACELMGTWSEHVASWAGVPYRPIYFVRYEDLVSDTGRTFNDIVRFIGLRPNKEQIAKSVERSSFEKLQRQEIEKGFRERPDVESLFFRRGGVGQWKETLSQNQIHSICRYHASMMLRFGYIE